MLAALVLPLRLAATTSPEAAQWFVAGSRLYYQRQYDQALQDFGQSLKLDNTQAAVYQYVGNCYYQKNQMAYALRYYKYALQLQPNNAALSGLVARLSGAQSDPLAQGNALYMAKRYSEALTAYQAVSAANPQNAKAFQCIGNCQYAMGDRVSALASYQQALALNPSNQPLAAFVARLQQSQAVASNPNAPKDWVQPLWRSAILPGWGQFYNDQDTKGLVLGGLAIGLAAATVATDIIGQGAENTYMGLGANLAQSAYDSPYNTWSNMAEINHVCYIAFGAVYVYTLLDAAVNAKPFKTLADVPQLLPNVDVALMDHGVQMKWKVAEF
jgi:tetratricopeptide (TPR) repeat protein